MTLLTTQFIFSEKKLFSYEEIEKRKKIIQLARASLIYQNIGNYRKDCSGFIEYLYSEADLNIKNYTGGSEDSDSIAYNLYTQLKGEFWNNPSIKMPLPGDIIFFDNTYDRNQNRKWDDPITHIGIVEKIEPTGRIHFIHLMNGKIRRDYVHPSNSMTHQDKGNILNSFLRRRPKNDNDRNKYLASSLFRGFANGFPIFLKSTN